MPPPYVIDANIWINVWRTHPPDIYVNVWQRIDAAVRDWFGFLREVGWQL